MRGRQRGIRFLRVRPGDVAPGEMRDNQSGVEEVTPRRKRTGMLRGRGVSTVLLESSGDDVRGSTNSLSASSLGPLRLTSALAALLLAVSSRGDIAVLAVLLAITAGNRLLTIAILAPSAAVIVSYGSGSLSALAGIQSVIGPAGLAGSLPQALGAWLGAAAIISSALVIKEYENKSNTSWTVALAFGTSASLLVFGPSASSGFLLRAGAMSTAVLFIRHASRFIKTLRATKAMSWLSLILGIASLVMCIVVRAMR